MSRKMYHICFTSHQEVLCRSYKDYCMMFNCIAQAVLKTRSNLLAYSVMSTHVHMVCECESPSDLVKRIRSSYTQMFNHRYGRKGTLGEESFFRDQLEGRRHVTTAISYVVRNPLHHEVCANPYAYPFSSVSQYFKNSMDRFAPDFGNTGGKGVCKSDIIREGNVLPENVCFWRQSGMIRMEDVVDNVMTEGYFGSYRAFMYGLSRSDYERWSEEQYEDNVDLAPVTIRTIEPFLSENEEASVLRQNYHWSKERRMTDIELCDLVDRTCRLRLGKSGYAQLTAREAESVRRQILQACKSIVSSKQMDRCLHIP